jgi:hypothetical protein
MKSRRWFRFLSVMGLLVSLSMSPSLAQADGTQADGRFSLGYYTLGIAAADNTLRLVNDGASIGNSADPSGTGLLCANIYVFDTTQHMLDCCSCAVSANGMLTLSVENNLLGPTTSVRAGTSGVIKVVSSFESTDKICAANSSYSAEPELVGWLSHYVGPPIFLTLTEEELEHGVLSPGELSKLQTTCLSGLNAKTVRACTCPAVSG